jgi:hypothetical protein
MRVVPMWWQPLQMGCGHGAASSHQPVRQLDAADLHASEFLGEDLRGLSD